MLTDNREDDGGKKEKDRERESEREREGERLREGSKKTKQRKCRIGEIYHTQAAGRP